MITPRNAPRSGACTTASTGSSGPSRPNSASTVRRFAPPSTTSREPAAAACIDPAPSTPICRSSAHPGPVPQPPRHPHPRDGPPARLSRFGQPTPTHRQAPAARDRPDRLPARRHADRRVGAGRLGLLRQGPHRTRHPRRLRIRHGPRLLARHRRPLHLDQTLESFLRGHVEAFDALGGTARTLVYDNLRSAVLDRRRRRRPVPPPPARARRPLPLRPPTLHTGRGNEKGKIERQIQYLRHAFFAARPFRDLDDLNAQFRRWRDDVAHQRRHPEQPDRTVAEVWADEKPRLLPLPAHPFETELVRVVRSGKTPTSASTAISTPSPTPTSRKPLTLLASDTRVRILDQQTELARHRRTYDTAQTVEDPAHLEGLLAATRQANVHTTRDRLRVAVPATAALFERLAERGEALRPHATRLLALLDDYGPRELAAAVDDALQRDALGAGSIHTHPRDAPPTARTQTAAPANPARPTGAARPRRPTP